MLFGIYLKGFLDPSQETQDLAVGSLVELPLWAARIMSRQKRQSFINVKMPKYFNENFRSVENYVIHLFVCKYVFHNLMHGCFLMNFREVLKADPAVVDLNKMGPYYYQAGLQLCTLPNEEAELISEVLPEVFAKNTKSWK